MNHDIYLERLQQHQNLIGDLLDKAMMDQAVLSNLQNELKEAIQDLTYVSDAIPRKVGDQIDSRLKHIAETTAACVAKRLEDANEKAERASFAYQKATSFAIWKVASAALLVTTICCAGIYLVIRLLLPTSEEMLRLQQQKNALEEKVALLDQRGGNFDIVSCMDGKREALCAAIEDKETKDGHFLIKQRPRP